MDEIANASRDFPREFSPTAQPLTKSTKKVSFFQTLALKKRKMGTETSKIVLNAHVHLRKANQEMSRPKRQIDDITDMRRSCRPRDNISGRHPLGSSSRLLKVHDDDHDDDDDDDDDDDGGDDDEHGAL